ncbi:MAG: hypothetical protein QW703_00960 [Candidatus Aenigmatarchaeota archaeon]
MKYDFADKKYLNGQGLTSKYTNIGLGIAFSTLLCLSVYFFSKDFLEYKEKNEEMQTLRTIEYRLKEGDNITNLCKKELRNTELGIDWVPLCRNYVCKLNDLSCPDDPYIGDDKKLPIGYKLIFPDFNNDGKIGDNEF